MHMCICPYDERIVGLITRQRAEQIGRNIGQHGCVITEQRHLPECPMLEPFSAERKQHCFCTRKNPCIHDEMECICERLSACEKRVIDVAVQRVEAFEYISTVGVTLSSVVPKAAVIAAIKGDQP